MLQKEVVIKVVRERKQHILQASGYDVMMSESLSITHTAFF